MASYVNKLGVVELNHVAFRRDGRIVAQTPFDFTGAGVTELDNGAFLERDVANGKLKFATSSTKNLLLNYSAEHFYRAEDAGLKEFCLKSDDGFLPRAGYVAPGDVFTTTYVNASDSVAAGAYASIGSNGMPTVQASKDSNSVLQVIEKTTVPDGSPAIKFIVL